MFDKVYIDRFNLKWKVNTSTGCWEWTASLAGKGYGQVKLPRQRRQEYAHRVAFIIHKGAIPKGKYVRHTCDNPRCVNPEHLFLGTSLENQLDMVNKGRSLYGEKNPNAALNEKSVQKIRALLQDGLPQTKIARMLGVSQMTISRIKRGERWKHF